MQHGVKGHVCVARFVLNRFRNTSSVNNMLEALGWPTQEQ